MTPINIFLSIIILGVIIMLVVNPRTKKITRVSGLKAKKIKSKRLMEAIKAIEKFTGKAMNAVSKGEIETCNKILVERENDCNCFVDSNKEFPDLNVSRCMREKNTKKCRDYNTCKKKFIKFMSNSEPNYDPDSWSSPIIEGSHNCYTYFLNDHIPTTMNKCRKLCKAENNCKRKTKSCGNLKPQPGKYASTKPGNDKYKNRKYTCPDMQEKVLMDNFNDDLNSSVIHPVPFSASCPKHHYKGALVVDPDNTYHFYRQDNNVRWSHKQGTLRVENVDASGKAIYAPHLSDMNYNKEGKNNGINYTKFCNYMCIPNNDYLQTHAL